VAAGLTLTPPLRLSLRSVSSSTCPRLCNRTPCCNAQSLRFSWPPRAAISEDLC
jgi:hypothetical protein